MLEPGTASRTFSIGVDLGGTSLRVSALAENGERLNNRSLATRVSDGPDAVVSDICDAIRSSLADAGNRLPLKGIGLGSPGPLALPEGRLLHLPNFPGWDGFELKQAVEANLGMPVIVESDANAAALAEWQRGAGKALDVGSLCMLTLGTGVGNGIILNRRIWHGMNGMGGEAGHAPDLSGRRSLRMRQQWLFGDVCLGTGMRRMALERARAGTAPRAGGAGS